MADCTDIQTKLTQAEAAFHALQTGKAVRKWVDQNGEQVEYAYANIGQLASYIQQLKDELADCQGTTPTYRGPIRFLFGRRGIY